MEVPLVLPVLDCIEWTVNVSIKHVIKFIQRGMLMQSYCSSSYKDHIEIHIYMWLCVKWAKE